MSIRITENKIKPTDCSESLSLFNTETIKQIQLFHKSFPQYKETPLKALKNLSAKLGAGGIYVKDESERFGLSSFKALGCTYAVASYIAQRLGKDISELDYKTLPEASKELGEFTFYAATDGNHGRAVAWAARQLGQKAVIYMNKGCPEVRADHIRKEGAHVVISDLNYDDTIRHVRKLADETPNSVIVQDTAWDGYEQIPGWIMQGYAVMTFEACRQLEDMAVMPTHVILQAGVGAFAGSAQGFISSYYGETAPVSVIVEPHSADCYFKSAQRGDGEAVCVGGEMETIMAGLACGEPNPISWDILKNKSKYFTSIGDEYTKTAMRTLAKPDGDDTQVTSGESGAAGMGLLLGIMTSEEPEMIDFRRKTGLGEDSHILIFSTEGDTDPESYKNIVEN